MIALCDSLFRRANRRSASARVTPWLQLEIMSLGCRADAPPARVIRESYFSAVHEAAAPPHPRRATRASDASDTIKTDSTDHAVSSRFFNAYSISRAALVVGVLGASYIYAKVPRVPVILNGPFFLACVLAACALACILATRPAGSNVRLPAGAMVFAGAWLLIALAREPTTTPRAMFAYAVAVTFVPLTAFLSVVVIGSSARGRICVLEGLSIGGILTAVLGIVEAVIQRSPIHQFGVSRGITFQYLPTRFGLHRAEAAFSHPIMLAGFLALSMLATLELMRTGRTRFSVGVPILVVQFVGVLSTVSRGPLLAVLCVLALWAAFASNINVRRRLAMAVPVALVLAIGLSQANVNDVGSFVQSSPGNPNGAVTYRASLYRAAIAALPNATAFGVAPTKDVGLGATFPSLDSEPVNLLVSTGVAGLVVFTGAIAWAIGQCLTRVGRKRRTVLFTTLGGLLLLLLGASAAFFGLFNVYVFVFLGLMWAQAPALPSEANGAQTRPR